MSIKSTSTITKSWAIECIKNYYEGYMENKNEVDRLLDWDYSDDYLEESKISAERIFNGNYDDISNEELESIMQCMNDLMALGESFNNYIVEEE